MALRAMESGNRLRPRSTMGKPEFIAHHQWPFNTEECARCGLKNQDPEKLARDAMTPAQTCKWCGALCCSRAMCWRNHLTGCFVSVCVDAMISAAAMFDAPRVFATTYSGSLSDVSETAFGAACHAQVDPVRAVSSDSSDGKEGEEKM